MDRVFRNNIPEKINPTINQSSTAWLRRAPHPAYRDALGSGAKYLAQIGTSTAQISSASNNAGNVPHRSNNGTIQIGQTSATTSAQALTLSSNVAGSGAGASRSTTAQTKAPIIVVAHLSDSRVPEYRRGEGRHRKRRRNPTAESVGAPTHSRFGTWYRRYCSIYTASATGWFCVDAL